MYAWFVLIGVVVAVAIPAVYAQTPELQTVTLSVNLEDTERSDTHNMVLSCSDSVLVYGLNLFIPQNDATDRYTIHENSIRLGAQTIQHDPYTSGNHHVRVSLLEGGGGPNLKYPLLLPKYTSLIIPIGTLDGTAGKDVTAILDVTYASNSDIQCVQKGLYGPQKIGFLSESSSAQTDASNYREITVQIAVDSYNQYLKGLGEQWWLEVTSKESASDSETALIKVREFYDEGIDIVIGPSASSLIAALYDITDRNDMMLLSCCSTAPSLSISDHIFRLTPDDTNQARALAAVLTSDGIDTVVTVYRDDPYGEGLSGALAKEMEYRGGIVASAMHYPPNVEDLDAATLSNGLASTIRDLSEVNGADRVAVVVISFGEVADIAEASLEHSVLSQVRWYGSESVVNLKDMTEGELGAFSEAVKLSGVIQYVAPNPLNVKLSDELRTHLDLSPDETVNVFAYSTYDAVLVLANAMLSTQSSDTDTLIEAIPYTAMRMFGALNHDSLNENGDLAAADYGIWQVIDKRWENIGTYLQSSDMVVLP